jgi:simple sugar transport system permease protein
LLVISLALASVGRNPFLTFAAIFEGAFGSAFSIQETLTRATPILLCALAAALPARAGLSNIGGEGQLHMGAVAATAVVLLAPALPGGVMIATILIAAAAAGAAFAALAGVLRAFLGVNEVLSGLMLNYIGILLVEYLVHGPWKDPSALGWPYSVSFPPAAVLPKLGQSNIHAGLVLGVAIALILALLWQSTKWGLAIRVLEDNPLAARFAGINVQAYFIILIALGGACAAIAGLGEVSVVQGRLRSGISPGYGYIGFMVSWLAGHQFLALIPISIIVGGLYSGADALQLTAGLPASTADIFLALAFLAFLLRARAVRRGIIAA